MSHYRLWVQERLLRRKGIDVEKCRLRKLPWSRKLACRAQNNQVYLPALSPWKLNKNGKYDKNAVLPDADKLQKGFNALTPDEQRIFKECERALPEVPRHG